MEKIYETCCGIDVHKKLMVACLRKGNSICETRSFGATTDDLKELAAWLKENTCEIAAMESTASYWKPLYNILEEEGLNAIVVNASHVKQVPGRKTDVNDAQWLADLLQHGLLNPSFIPGKRQRELRELTTYRKSITAEKTRDLNRMQKVMEGGNIKLSGTLSDIKGKTASNLIKCVVSGETIDSEKYDQMYQEGLIAHNIKASKEQIIADMNGVFSDMQKALLKKMQERIDREIQDIKDLDTIIDEAMTTEEKQACTMIQDIPGIGEVSSKLIVSVLGTDMSRFPDDNHISSWAGLCPGNNQSAGKRRSSKTTKGNNLLRSTLVICAHGAVKDKSTFYHAQYERIRKRRGNKRAIVAVAHSMLIAIYHMLKYGEGYKELGSDYYYRYVDREAQVQTYIRKLNELGYAAKLTAF